MKSLLLCLFLSLCGTSLAAQDMNNQRMEEILRTVADSITGEAGRWEFHYGGVVILGLTDERHDRMRLISPVRHVDEATPAEIFACMEANFHSALDVKYALSDDLIWVVFIHPLSPLRESQLLSALDQVRSAALTYGSTYTSTDLVFPGSKAERKQKQAEAEKKRGSKM